MKKKILSLLLIVAFTGCSSTQFQETMTEAESLAWTFAGGYETANAATGGAITKSLLNAGLVATHNTPDEAVVDALGASADAAIKTQAAAVANKLAASVVAAGNTAAANGASPAGIQAAQTAALSDPGVIATAAAAAPALAVPVGALSTLAAVPNNP
jgi:fatty acid/phospholipid biosynthesis enzyme